MNEKEALSWERRLTQLAAILNKLDKKRKPTRRVDWFGDRVEWVPKGCNPGFSLELVQHDGEKSVSMETLSISERLGDALIARLWRKR